MIVDILQTGAQAFVLIVSLLLAFVAGLSTIDYLKTRSRENNESQD